MWYINTIEYYSAIKKNEILPFETMLMDLEDIMLSEVGQTEKGKYDFTCKWNLKNKISKQKQTHSNKL